MFEAGLIEETRALLDRYGADKNITPLESLGYKQAAQFLRGELPREQAIAAAQQGHRNYAKRQMTWFRREPDVVWLEGFGDTAEIAQAGCRTGFFSLNAEVARLTLPDAPAANGEPVHSPPSPNLDTRM